MPERIAWGRNKVCKALNFISFIIGNATHVIIDKFLHRPILSSLKLPSNEMSPFTEGKFYHLIIFLREIIFLAIINL